MFMRERATLRLDNGAVLRVELDGEDLDRDEVVVHRAPDNGGARTTDRLLEADPDRPY